MLEGVCFATAVGGANTKVQPHNWLKTVTRNEVCTRLWTEGVDMGLFQNSSRNPPQTLSLIFLLPFTAWYL